MSKTWIFFKLRLLQLRYDKTALFFSYILPVLLLMGIGYPMELMNKSKIEVQYADEVGNEMSRSFIDSLSKNEKVKLIKYQAKGLYRETILNGDAEHILIISENNASSTNGVSSIFQGIKFQLLAPSHADHFLESKALARIISEHFHMENPDLTVLSVDSGSINSYIATLLPGLIGMTLLIIGLNGFGGVLIEESHEGLFKNVKTIDASPIPFLSGLLLSRLMVSYSVAAALFAIGIFMFGLNVGVDFILLFLVLTLGCIAFLGIGLVIAVFSPSVNSFNGIVNFVEIPFLIFSGVFFSITAFPNWLQILAQAIPLTHMNNALHAIIFDGVGLTDISSISVELGFLFAWSVGTLLFGWKRFKW